MKITKLSLAAAIAVSLCSVASANSFTDALQNGKTSGEATVTFETRNMDDELSNYYQDTGYSVASVALGYTSGIWNNLSITSKFRAYKTVWEDDYSSTTAKGTGDASERFWETGDNQTVDFEDLYIAYKNDNVTIKAGRQALNTKWLNKTHDAVNANAKFGATNVELIWTRQMGRVTSRDYRPLSASDGVFLNKVEPNNGVYKLGVTHDFGDIDLMAFYLRAPQDRDLIGGQAAYSNGTLGASAQYTAHRSEVDGTEDGSHTELKAFAKVSGYTATLAYLITEDTFKHFGMGTTNAMEEGDHLYAEDAKTTYLKINKTFADLSVTLLSTMSEYGTTTSYTSYENTLWLGYPFTKNIKGNLGYTIVSEDSDDATTTSLDQLNMTLAYKF